MSKINSVISCALFIILGALNTASIGQESYTCEICSHIVEIDRLKARCFQKRYNKLIASLADDTVQHIPVNFRCLKSRDVTKGVDGNLNINPNIHFLTRDAIQCLKRIVSDKDSKFTPAMLISFENDC